MDCQYEYISARDLDHHGLLSHHSSQWIDPVAEKGVEITGDRAEWNHF